MEIKKIKSSQSPERIYIAACEMAQFKGKKNVEVQLFRIGADPGELQNYSRKQLVGPPPADLPPEILQGCTEEAVMECLLEAFTEKEADELCAYMQERYNDQITKITICPLSLPVPLGVGPLARIPATSQSGFINFDLAPGYSLEFAFRGYYDLDGQEE